MDDDDKDFIYSDHVTTTNHGLHLVKWGRYANKLFLVVVVTRQEVNRKMIKLTLSQFQVISFPLDRQMIEIMRN